MNEKRKQVLLLKKMTPEQVIRMAFMEVNLDKFKDLKQWFHNTHFPAPTHGDDENKHWYYVAPKKYVSPYKDKGLPQSKIEELYSGHHENWGGVSHCPWHAWQHSINTEYHKVKSDEYREQPNFQALDAIQRRLVHKNPNMEQYYLEWMNGGEPIKNLPAIRPKVTYNDLAK